MGLQQIKCIESISILVNVPEIVIFFFFLQKGISDI